MRLLALTCWTTLAVLLAMPSAAIGVTVANLTVRLWSMPAPRRWPSLAWIMATHPRTPATWPAGGVAPDVALALAMLVWLFLLGAAVAGFRHLPKRRHRPGTARPVQLHTLRTAAIIRSARMTRPATALPRGGWSARRLGLHQYGSRIGTLVGPSRVALRAKWEDSTIAIAPPRGHKTAAVGIPRVLDAPGAVITTSTKADLLLATVRRRAQLGRIWVLDGEGIADPLAPGWLPLRWDPLTGCADPATAIRRASALVGARPLGAVRNADFFAGQANDVLRCWLMAAALGGHRIEAIGRWLHNLADETPAELLDVRRPDWAARLRGLATNTAGEMVGGIVGTLQLVLSPLDTPRIAAICHAAPSESFDIAAFLASTDSLYLLTEGEANSAGPFVTALVDEIVHTARRASQHRPAERLDPPLSLVLDEPANTAALPKLPTYMSDSGGRGISLCLLPQGWGQMRSRWAQDGAKEIFNSATLALVMGGGKESDFLEDVSRLTGEYRRRTRSVSTGRGGRAVQHADHLERIMTVGDVRTISDGQALMLYQRLPPAVVSLPTWFRSTSHRQIRTDIAAVREERNITAGTP